jgi:voltage-gated potassium channel
MDGSKSEAMKSKEGLSGWRLRLYEIIFEADTIPGKLFDIAVLICILLSVLVVMLESVQTIGKQMHSWLWGLE